MNTFYRVGHIDNQQGLWYSPKGDFVGLIHTSLNFCTNSELEMPFNQDVVGFLSATKTLQELFAWFTPKDIKRLETLGFCILKYEADDFKYHQNHWLIDQFTSKLIEVIKVDDVINH